MTVLRLLFVLLLAFAASFGVSFLSSGWRRRRKPEAAAARIESLLPGYDCGLCGYEDCRGYADAIAMSSADPGLCSPGAFQVERVLRSALSEAGDTERGTARIAVILCGGSEGLATSAFDYDGYEDCAAAAALYGGPKHCKEGCVGFGSCAKVCPLGAIRMEGRLARVDPLLCTGCGLCVPICPTRIIALVPEGEEWIVACSSRREAEAKNADCAAACIACGDCVRRSYRGEFSLEGNLAQAHGVRNGLWPDIAPHCPTKAIVSGLARKKS